MRTLTTLFLLTFCLALSAQSTAALTGDGVETAIDFTQYTGTGIAPDPTNGELNSNNWSVLGMSDGNIPFGSTTTDGDFEGQTDGTGVTGGGLYAYSNGDVNALWVQPTSSDFSPGSLILKLSNETGGTVTSVNLQYIIHVLNDGDRANSFNPSYSTNGADFFPLDFADLISEELADGSFQSLVRVITIENINLPAGEDMFLQWTSDDISGMGSRDEFGLSDIVVTPFNGNASPIVNFTNGTLQVNEADDFATFSVMVSEEVSCGVNISIDPISTAQVGIDFLDTASGFYTFSESQSIELSLDLLDDIVTESDETIVLNISGVSDDCVIGGGNQLVINITDND